MKLTPSQREILKIVGERGRMATSVRTSFGRVSGVSAAALVRKGLLRYVGVHVRGMVLASSFDVEITDEGRKVLEGA